MKKWLILLALSLAITGCTGKKEGMGQIGKIKIKNEKITAAIKDVGTNKHDLVLFLNRAEHVFEDLQYAAATMPKGKKVKEDGITYRELPARLNSREKIIAYFSRFWSRPLAVKMYDNLHTKIVKGKVYLAEGTADYHVLITVKNTSVDSGIKGITATVKEATLPSFAMDRTITYRLVRDKKTKHYEISERKGTYGKNLFE